MLSLYFLRNLFYVVFHDILIFWPQCIQTLISELMSETVSNVLASPKQAGNFQNVNLGVEPKIGVKPPKWMVKIMENPMNKWMIWGAHPYFWFNTHLIKLEYYLVMPSTKHEDHLRATKKDIPPKKCSSSFPSQIFGVENHIYIYTTDIFLLYLSVAWFQKTLPPKRTACP